MGFAWFFLVGNSLYKIVFQLSQTWSLDSTKYLLYFFMAPLGRGMICLFVWFFLKFPNLPLSKGAGYESRRISKDRGSALTRPGGDLWVALFIFQGLKQSILIIRETREKRKVTRVVNEL